MAEPAAVDVLVASFRRPHSLAAALESVERVREAAGDRLDLRVQVVDEEQGSGAGPAAARNLAAARGDAEFIAILDDDDLWLPGRLDRAIEILREREDVGLVCGDARLRSGGTWLGDRPRGDRHHRDLCMDDFVCTSTVTMRRAHWERLDGMDDGLRLAEDYDLWLRLTRYGLHVHVLDEVLAVRDDTSGGLSADPGALAAATLDVLHAHGFPGFLDGTWARRLATLQGAAAHYVMKETGDWAEGRRLALKALGGAPDRKVAWTALLRSVLRTKRSLRRS